MMNADGQSDRAILPRKQPNKATDAAETAEGRARPKGNPLERGAFRTQSREDANESLERVREAATRKRKERFTALLHHVYNVSLLRSAYRALKRDAAAGVDGETWQHYGESLGANLQDLSERLQRGAYRAQPVRRVYIPKPDGRQRPLGVPTLEDKLVQRAVVEVLSAIYEPEFLGFSYGFRPGRSQHGALDALTAGLMTRKVNWVLDADIQAFFDTVDHGWMLRFLEHRIADQRILRLVRKWLEAGAMEEGHWTPGEVGTVQGGSISPLLANVYLHYAFDLWAHRWRQQHAHGDVIIVRFADDVIVGFQHHGDAEQFLRELRERFAKFALKLHPDKTRLIEFGRFAADNHQERGQGRPGTFNFLGFTHACGKTRQGRFTVRRRTMRQRWQGKLQAVATALRARLHAPVPEIGAYLRAVLLGHFRYYGVPGNTAALGRFARGVAAHWRLALSRRSQHGRVSWARLARLRARWFPPVRVYQPYPARRLVARRPV